MSVLRVSPFAVYALLAAFASEMFLGDIDIGPVSPRVYVYLFLLAWMAFRIIVSGDALRLDGAGAMLIALYAIFLVWCAVAMFYQGVSLKRMAVRFASYDFVAVAGFLLILFIIRDRRSLKRFVIGFTVLVALSSAVAFVQATGLPASWRLVMRLRPQFAATLGDQIVFRSIFGPVPVFPPGLYASTFTFGYFLAAVAVIALALFVERRSVRRLMLVIMILASLVVVQQRSAVLAAGVTCATLMLVQFRRARRRSLVVATALVLLGLVAVWSGTRGGGANFGRLRSFFDPGRVQIAAIATGYIASHPFVGGTAGYLEYFAQSVDVTTEYDTVAPHNMFLNAGVFYGVPAILLLCVFLGALALVMVNAWRVARRRDDLIGAAAVLSLLAYLLNAQFHNASFVSGDPLPWWLIAAVLLSRRLPAPLRRRTARECLVISERYPSGAGAKATPDRSVG